MRIIFFKTLNDGLFIIRILKQLDKALLGYVCWVRINEWFYEQIIDDFAWLFTFTSIDS